MADTARNIADLQTLLATNGTGSISAQDIRDFLVSCVNNQETAIQTIASDFTITGKLGLGITPTAQLHVIPSSAATVGLLVKGVASQSGNLTTWRNSSDTILGSFSPAGVMTAASFSGIGTALTALSGTNITTGTLPDARLSSNVPLKNANNIFTGINTFNDAVTVGNSSTLNVSGTISGDTQLFIYGVSNLDNGLIYTDGSGVITVGGLYAIGTTNLDDGAITTDGSGGITLGALTAGGNGLFGTNVSASTATPINVSFGGTFGNSTPGSFSNLKWDLYNDGVNANRYGIGMSAGLMEFRAGASAALGFFVNNGVQAMSMATNCQVTIGTGQAASVVPLVVKGVTSQSANLTEWQNNSNQVLASIDIQSGGTPSYNYGRLKLAYGEDPSKFAEFYLSEDVSNAATSAMYLIPPNDFTRMHFGTAVKRWFSLDLQYVNSIENMPVFTQNGMEFGYYPSSAFNIGRDNGVNNNLILTSSAPTVGGGGIIFNTGAAFGTYSKKLELNSDGTLIVNGFAAATIGQIVRGAASQTANLLELQNNSSAVLAKVTAAGDIQANSNNTGFVTLGGLPADRSYAGLWLAKASPDASNYVFLSGASDTNTYVNCPSASSVVFRINNIDKLNVSNVASVYTELRIASTSGGIICNAQGELYIDNSNASGSLIFRPGGQVEYAKLTSDGTFQVYGGAAGIVKTTIKAHASQSVNLTEWQNSGGTALSAIAKNGAFKPASLADADAENNTIYYSTTASKLAYKDGGGTVNVLY